MKDNILQVKTKETKDVSITFRATSSLNAEARNIATEMDRSLGYICVEALKEYISRRKGTAV